MFYDLNRRLKMNYDAMKWLAKTTNCNVWNNLRTSIKWPGDGSLKKKSFAHILQPKMGLVTSSSLFAFHSNFHNKRLGWKTKMKLDFLSILDNFFANYLIYKRVTWTHQLFLLFLPKLNSDLEVVPGMHFLHIFS